MDKYSIEPYETFLLSLEEEKIYALLCLVELAGSKGILKSNAERAHFLEAMAYNKNKELFPCEGDGRISCGDHYYPAWTGKRWHSLFKKPETKRGMFSFLDKFPPTEVRT